MNSHDNDFFKKLMKAALIASVSAEISERSKMSRHYLEHHPSIETDVTDEDMLLMQIDMALDMWDMQLFMQLTDELKGMEVLL